jgi:hypothetical protein
VQRPQALLHRVETIDRPDRAQQRDEKDDFNAFASRNLRYRITAAMTPTNTQRFRDAALATLSARWAVDLIGPSHCPAPARLLRAKNAV